MLIQLVGLSRSSYCNSFRTQTPSSDELCSACVLVGCLWTALRACSTVTHSLMNETRCVHVYSMHSCAPHTMFVSISDCQSVWWGVSGGEVIKNRHILPLVSTSSCLATLTQCTVSGKKGIHRDTHSLLDVCVSLCR